MRILITGTLLYFDPATDMSSELSLAVKSDYPAKQSSVKLQSTTSVGELKKECAKALGIASDRYDFHSVTLGADCNLLADVSKVIHSAFPFANKKKFDPFAV